MPSGVRQCLALLQGLAVCRLCGGSSAVLCPRARGQASGAPMSRVVLACQFSCGQFGCSLSAEWQWGDQEGVQEQSAVCCALDRGDK